MEMVVAVEPKEIIARLVERGWRVALAESCTAGMVASTLAEVSGASAALWGSFVTYTLAAKEAMLGVPAALLARYGAVSEECALAMAAGALAAAGVEVAVSVTGLAGPAGDGSDVTVGTVWVGVCRTGEAPGAWRYHFEGNRQAVREAACDAALQRLWEAVSC
jgi:PncC family amidohydrolase